jgi:nitroimidazol reductase NimA-like FMN-containing flavoprotein (pyridoxamine 5'-phosphate oxidase superfamily)
MELPLSGAAKAFIAPARVCRIATVLPGGEPHVIPVCPVFDGETTVYVDISPNSATARAVAHDNRVAVIFDVYDDDWSRLKKVILKCRAERVTGAEQDTVWREIRATYPQYVTVNWEPRLTLALRPYAWLQDGIEPAG